MVAAAAAIGTWLLSSVAAIARAEQFEGFALYSSSEMQRLLLAVVLAIALPSSCWRPPQGGSLRRCGAAARQPAVAGYDAGADAHGGGDRGRRRGGRRSRGGAGRLPPHQARARPAQRGGAGGSVDSLRPHSTDYVLVVVLVPLVVVALAALPARVDMKSALSRARKADARRPSWLRVVPLAVGVALCGYVISQRSTDNPPGPVVVSLFGGIVLLGLGAILVVPIFVRLVADLLLRLSRGPATMVAARRLQAQPAAVTRVISGLLIGLFLVTGARSVVVAFESTQQYVDAARQINDEQRVVVPATAGTAASVIRARRAGRRRTSCGGVLVPGRRMWRSDSALLHRPRRHLRRPAPGGAHLTGCRDDRPTVARCRGRRGTRRYPVARAVRRSAED